MPSVVSAKSKGLLSEKIEPIKQRLDEVDRFLSRIEFIPLNDVSKYGDQAGTFREKVADLLGVDMRESTKFSRLQNRARLPLHPDKCSDPNDPAAEALAANLYLRQESLLTSVIKDKWESGYRLLPESSSALGNHGWSVSNDSGVSGQTEGRPKAETATSNLGASWMHKTAWNREDITRAVNDILEALNLDENRASELFMRWVSYWNAGHSHLRDQANNMLLRCMFDEAKDAKRDGFDETFERWDPLLYAHYESLTDLMILLLDLDNVTFNITNLHRVDDFALLNEVIRLDNLDVVHAMLDHPECDVNVTDGIGDTALHLAADKHRSDNGQYLSLILNSRSNADIGRLDALQRTPLVRAVLAGNLANVNLLLDRCFGNAGEDIIGRRDAYGKSALDYAIQLNQREAVVAIRNWFVSAVRYY